MKEIAIISGKGGTGKTSITGSLAYFAGENAVIADCDVDAADMHLLMKPNINHKEDFFSGKIAQIDNEICTNCGICKSICRFDAIPIIDNNHTISEIDCEGCGYCEKVCPVNAITMKDNLAGDFYISDTRMNNQLVHAALRIGAENSGKLVSKVRKEAKALAEKLSLPYVIIDGTPGIGCPVIASVTGVDYVVMVTEPTISGFHDLERVYELVKKFKIPAACIINKADLNKDVLLQTKVFLEKNNISLLAELPYDNIFTEAITVGKTVVEYNQENEIYKKIESAWNEIKSICEHKNTDDTD